MTIVVTMFKLLFTMCVGIYLNKKGILTPDTNKKLSSMIVDVTVPFLIIASVGSITDGSQGDVLLMLFGGIALYCTFPLLGWLAALLVRAPKGTKGIYMCTMMFANTAFMGYPVVQALYGETAIFYTTIFNFGYNILFYTLASFLIDRDAGAASSFDMKRLLTPGLIVGVLAVAVNLTGFKLPQLILQPSSFIGNITTPLSMLIIGANMADYSIKDIFGEKRIYVITVLRLLVMPILTACYLNVLTDNKPLICMSAITIGMPVGSMVAMAGSRYESTARLSNICVVMSTICSMVTIPILAIIFRIWFGI